MCGCKQLKVILITDIRDPNIALALQVYPNPASNSLTVDFGARTSAESKLELVNAFGQIVLKKNVDHIVTILLDMSIYADGIYMLQVTRDGNIMRSRIVIQK